MTSSRRSSSAMTSKRSQLARSSSSSRRRSSLPRGAPRSPRAARAAGTGRRGSAASWALTTAPRFGSATIRPSAWSTSNVAHRRPADPELAGQLLFLQRGPGSSRPSRMACGSTRSPRARVLDQLPTFFEGPRHRRDHTVCKAVFKTGSQALRARGSVPATTAPARARADVVDQKTSQPKSITKAPRGGVRESGDEKDHRQSQSDRTPRELRPGPLTGADVDDRVPSHRAEAERHGRCDDQGDSSRMEGEREQHAAHRGHEPDLDECPRAPRSAFPDRRREPRPAGPPWRRR